MKKITIFEVGNPDAGLFVHFRFTVLQFLATIATCILLGILFGALGMTTSLGSTRSRLLQDAPPTSALLASNESSAVDRLEFIRNMTRHAWSSLALRNASSGGGWLDDYGATTIGSLSTLWIMNLKEQYSEGRDWVKMHFQVKKITSGMYVFHLVADYLGPLLSCYALTQDEMFLEKAKEVGKVIEAAILPGALPHNYIFPHANAFPGGLTHELAQLTGQHLELYYLSHLTNTTTHLGTLSQIRQTLANLPKPRGLYLTKLTDNKWISTTSSLFWPSSFFYSYLVKSYLQSGRSDTEALQMYTSAMDAVERATMITKSSTSGLVYARNFDVTRNETGNFMQFDGCNLGATLALGATVLGEELTRNRNLSLEEKVTKQNRVDQHWFWAKAITETCHLVAAGTQTGLLPWKMYFNETKVRYSTNGRLSPDLAESYFYLYRLTKDPAYRTYAWELTQSMYQNARTPSGTYRNLVKVDVDVNLSSTQGDFTAAKHFIGATLKYLYLIYAGDTILPLEKWVFNAFGAPLPML